jgi:hypothetical protein
MARVGFEPTIQVFERAKTVHALDSAATVIGGNNTTSCYLLSTHLAGITPHSSLLWKIAPCIPSKSAGVSEEHVTSKFVVERKDLCLLPTTCLLLALLILDDMFLRNVD